MKIILLNISDTEYLKSRSCMVCVTEQLSIMDTVIELESGMKSVTKQYTDKKMYGIKWSFNPGCEIAYYSPTRSQGLSLRLI